MKHLVLVKTIEILYSLQASITSLSLIDPPGWMTSFIPDFPIASILSLKGKKASEAKTPPSTRSYPIFKAICTASTLLTCPAPSPTVVFSFAIKIPFDLACFKTFHVKRAVLTSPEEGSLSVTISRSAFFKVLISTSWTSSPPSILRTSNFKLRVF